MHRRSTPAQTARPLWIRSAEFLSLCAFAVLSICLAARLEFNRWLWLTVPAAYLAADLASGVLHWVCDQYFTEHAPLFGRLLIQPFRAHHRDPQAITEHGFLELTGNSALVLNPVLAWGCWNPGAEAVLLPFSAALLGTNLFHRWAHADHLPMPVRVLQRCRLILTPEHHAIHHQDSHDRAFCVTTGWMNPLLDRVLGRRG